jgi:hypothetical protein
MESRNLGALSRMYFNFHRFEIFSPCICYGYGPEVFEEIEEIDTGKHFLERYQDLGK